MSYNFSPGPAILPQPVRDQIVEHLSNAAHGLSILEISHRSDEYEAVHNNAVRLCRSLYGLPDDMEVLLLGGGASLQFAMVAMNLLPTDGSADYVETGLWSKKAAAEAERLGKTVRVAGSSSDRNFTYIPDQESLHLDPGAAYVHLTSNNTIVGTQFSRFPETGSVPIAADLTSDLLSRPVSWEDIGVVYAGTQKNAGIAGCTVVFVRRELLAREMDDMPAVLRYSTYADSNSLYNTPPVFAVYVLDLVLRWLDESGGLEAAARRNAHKASLIYEVIDGSESYYRGFAERSARSQMNVTFGLPEPDQTARFAEEAFQQGFVGLRGHRSIGGLRASLYNGMSVEGCLALADFMRDFACQQ